MGHRFDVFDCPQDGLCCSFRLWNRNRTTGKPWNGHEANLGRCKPRQSVSSGQLFNSTTPVLFRLCCFACVASPVLFGSSSGTNLVSQSVAQFYYACVVSPVLVRLCCFACVVSPVWFGRFGVGVVVVVVIIAFTLMPFAMFAKSDRYLT